MKTEEIKIESLWQKNSHGDTCIMPFEVSSHLTYVWQYLERMLSPLQRQAEHM